MSKKSASGRLKKVNQGSYSSNLKTKNDCGANESAYGGQIKGHHELNIVHQGSIKSPLLFDPLGTFILHPVPFYFTPRSTFYGVPGTGDSV